MQRSEAAGKADRELCGAALHTHADPEFICGLMIIMVGLDGFVGGPTDFQTVSVCVCVCVCV